MTETPTGMLREEHAVILDVLPVLEAVVERGERDGEWDDETLADLIAFFRLFADACHHGKEEDLLFPELEGRGIPRDGGPIGVMLHEHRQGRAFVARMAEALERARKGEGEARAVLANAARGYVALLRGHIGKEDHVLFEMADRIVDGVACRRLCDAYGAVCLRRFGGRTKEELEALAADLRRRYPPGEVSGA